MFQQTDIVKDGTRRKVYRLRSIMLNTLALSGSLANALQGRPMSMPRIIRLLTL